MACLIKNCNIHGDNERMVVCWLCHEACHLKCCGLSGLIADALTNNKGLHWCCNDCRKIGVSFYRFFRDNKKKFLDIQDEAAKLSARINDYGKMFEDFKSLDNLKSPPESSPKRRKSSRNVTKDKRDNNVPDNNAPANNVPANNVPAKNVPADNTPSSSLCSTAPIVNNHNPDLPLTYAEVAINQHINIENSVNQNIHNPLRAVPPKKTIFVSRLANETTAKDVDFFVKSKVGLNAEISSFKFNFSQPRSIASFKVTVSMDIFERVLDPNFWPKNTLVREFTYSEKPRSYNIGRLPQLELNTQKN